MAEDTLSAKQISDRIAGSISLIDLRLRHVKANLFLLAPEPELEIWPTVEPSMTRLSDLVVYDTKYVIQAQDSRQRPAVEAEVTFTLIFQLADQSISSEDLAAFGAVGALSVAHPYVRELIHSLTARMGIPPLLLEVMPPESELAST
ncbi:hypothetical protein [Micromonospora sp. NPDC002717]|uniref:hypothetical protein n=1 Tax=Micromonospora sp. NPDC002717 TaxID=3154424 RepID=UPI0033276D65